MFNQTHFSLTGRFLLLVGTLTLLPSMAPAQVLEEIIVTAQRKAENVQDAAVPINVATAEDLNRAGVTGTGALNKVAPALYTTEIGGANAVSFVRGAGNFTANSYTDPVIAFNVYGVYIAKATNTTASFLDLERIEVLKGPQGTLYGRNATAGAVNVIPAKPVLGETEGYVRAGYGNYEAWNLSGAFNMPLGEDFAVRLAASTINNDGYNDDGTFAKEDIAFRGQIFGNLSEAIDVRLSVDHATAKGAGPGGSFAGNYVFVPGTAAGGLNISNYMFFPSPPDVGAPHTGSHSAAGQAFMTSRVVTPAFDFASPQAYPDLDNAFFGITGEINVDLGFGDLVIIAAYRESEIDKLFTNPGFQAATTREDHEQFSIEGRLSTTTGPVDWILGAYYFDESITGNASFNSHTVQSVQTYRTNETESTALFARATFNVQENFRLVGGIRWTDDKKRFDAIAETFIKICTRPPPPFGPGCFGGPDIPAGLSVADVIAQLPPAALPFGPPALGRGPVPFGAAGGLLLILPTPVDQSLADDEITFRVAIEYDVTDSNLLYASFESGYRSGGFSLAFGHETFEPEFLDAYTLGSKNLFMDGRLQLNAELFYWEYEDQQASYFGLDLRGNPSFFTQNIGVSTIWGLDVDFVFAVTDRALLKGTLQYLDNEMDSFRFAAQNVGIPPVSGCSFAPGMQSGAPVWLIDCSGFEGRNSPEFSANVGMEHSFDVGRFNVLVTVDGRYRGKRWIGFDYLPVQRADSSFSVDASLTMSAPDDNWYVTGFVRNFTDEDVDVFTPVFPAISNLASTIYEPPRTYGVELGFNF
ncbi:MAG: TonB-dependent receptor [Candidatus Latescibacteria bacterium]|nr:TonB-dependent receptor [Candidatus Latescibacterota bacterium]